MAFGGGVAERVVARAVTQVLVDTSASGRALTDNEQRVRASVSKVDRTLDRQADSFARRQKTMAKIGKATAVALAGGLGLVAVAANKAIQDASNLNEEIEKTNVVFGNSGKAVQAWATTLGDSFGISERAALAAAGAFGNMLVPMGVAPAKAAEMSKRLVELAGDMASFNNASPEDVLNALRSGLAGQVRPLRVFGVQLSQTAIQAEAVSSGIIKATTNTEQITDANTKAAIAQGRYTAAVKAHGLGSDQARSALVSLHTEQNAVTKAVKGHVGTLTAAQKEQAIYNLILRQTSIQQGDFARNTGSLANKQRSLQAAQETESALLGQKLLPLKLKLVKAEIALVQFTGKHTKEVEIGVGAFAALAAVVVTVSAAYKVYTTWQHLANAYNRVFKKQLEEQIVVQDAQKAATLETAGALEAQTVAQEEANAAAYANPYVLVAAAIIALGVAIYELIKHWKAVSHAATVAWDEIKNVVREAVDFIRDHWKLVLGIMLGPLGIFVGLVISHWKEIVGAAKEAMDSVVGVFESGWRLAGRGASFLKDAGVNAFHGIYNAALWVVHRIEDAYEGLVKRLQKLWDKVPGHNLVGTAVHYANPVTGPVNTVKAIGGLLGIGKAAGGEVPMVAGAQRGRDSVLIAATPGESILTGKDRQDLMTGQKTPAELFAEHRFAGGGLVPLPPSLGGGPSPFDPKPKKSGLHHGSVLDPNTYEHQAYIAQQQKTEAQAKADAAHWKKLAKPAAGMPLGLANQYAAASRVGDVDTMLKIDAGWRTTVAHRVASVPPAYRTGWQTLLDSVDSDIETIISQIPDSIALAQARDANNPAHLKADDQALLRVLSGRQQYAFTTKQKIALIDAINSAKGDAKNAVPTADPTQLPDKLAIEVAEAQRAGTEAGIRKQLALYQAWERTLAGKAANSKGATKLGFLQAMTANEQTISDLLGTTTDSMQLAQARDANKPAKLTADLHQELRTLQGRSRYARTPGERLALFNAIASVKDQLKQSAGPSRADQQRSYITELTGLLREFAPDVFHAGPRGSLLYGLAGTRGKQERSAARIAQHGTHTQIVAASGRAGRSRVTGDVHHHTTTHNAPVKQATVHQHFSHPNVNAKTSMIYAQFAADSVFGLGG